MIRNESRQQTQKFPIALRGLAIFETNDTAPRAYPNHEYLSLGNANYFSKLTSHPKLEDVSNYQAKRET